MSISRRSTLKFGLAAAAATLPMPFYARAQGTGWSKLRGQSIVVNWPAHPHYAVAKTLLPAFTAETGIKVGFSANRAALPANARTDIAVDTRPRTRLSTSPTLPDGLCGIDRILDFILTSGGRY